METSAKYVTLIYDLLKRMKIAMGDEAIDIAKKLGDIEFSWSDDPVGIKTDGFVVIQRLMDSYRRVLGTFANKVASDAIEKSLVEYPELDVPKDIVPAKVKMIRYSILKEKLKSAAKEVGL
ncbi:MAG: hypothetical protein HZB68_05260 [Candidatus Aenigmarchaeota archaeon]|nr:hypothetical protein [Candidatus Aenigmarchaeota archaeon]